MNSKYINYMNIEIHSGDKNRVTPSVEIVRDILEKENMKPIKGIYSKPLQLIMDLGKDYAISNRKELNNDWGFLKSLKKEMENEKENLLELFDTYYTTTISDNITPADIQRLTMHLETRMKNFMLVLRSKKDRFFGRTTGRKTVHLRKENISKEYEYDMTKIYWYNENGKKLRMLNKNFGASNELNFIEMFQDYLINHIDGIQIDGLNMREELSSLDFNYIPDLIIKLDGETWTIEFENDKNNLIELGVMFELWNKYKKTYL
jgi:hypothetical protein